MIIQIDLTPKIQVYTDEYVKLIRFWEDEDRSGEWWDIVIEDKIPRCITRGITMKQWREIEDIFKKQPTWNYLQAC